MPNAATTSAAAAGTPSCALNRDGEWCDGGDGDGDDDGDDDGDGDGDGDRYGHMADATTMMTNACKLHRLAE